MTRLPKPGSDDGDWGDILNDYLGIEHNTNGTLKKAGLITGAQQKSEKDQPGGYAGLDNDGLVAKTGDYIGLFANSFPVGPAAFETVLWGSTTTTRGASMAWNTGAPSVITMTAAGVYSVNLTVEWNDATALSSGTVRYAQILTTCGFTVQDQRAPVDIANGYMTIQNVSISCFLQPGQYPRVYLNHDASDPLDVSAKLLMTRIA